MIVFVLVAILSTGEQIPVAEVFNKSQCKMIARQLTDHPENMGVKIECRTFTKL